MYRAVYTVWVVNSALLRVLLWGLRVFILVREKRRRRAGTSRRDTQRRFKGGV